MDLIQESTKKCNELSALVKKLKKDKVELEEECIKQKGFQLQNIPKRRVIFHVACS